MNKQLELWVISQRIPQVPRQIVISLELSSLLFSDQDYLPSCTSPGIQQLCKVSSICVQFIRNVDRRINRVIPIYPPKCFVCRGEGGLTSLFSSLLCYTDLTEPLCNLYNKNELLIFNILQIKSIHYIIVTSMCLVYSRLCHLSLVRSKPSLASHPT